MMKRTLSASVLALCAACSSGDDAADTPDIPDTSPPPANRAPAFTGSAEAQTRENGEDTGLALTAEDADGDEVAFAITGGADADAFVLEGDRLLFAARPDFEAPTDQDGDNAYVVEIEASDGEEAARRVFTITVTDGPDGTLTQEGLLRLSSAPRPLRDLDEDGFAEVLFATDEGPIIARGAALTAAQDAVTAADLPGQQDGVLVTGDLGYGSAAFADYAFGSDVVGGGGADVIVQVGFIRQGTIRNEEYDAFVVVPDTDVLSAADEDGMFDVGAAVRAAGERAFVFEAGPFDIDSIGTDVFAAPLAADDDRAVLGFARGGDRYLFGAEDLPALVAASLFTRPPAGVGLVVRSDVPPSTGFTPRPDFRPIGDIDADGLTDFASSFATESLVETSIVFGDELPAQGRVALDALRTTTFITDRNGRDRVLAVEVDGEDGDDLVAPTDDLVVFSNAVTAARGGTLDLDSIVGSGDGYTVTDLDDTSLKTIEGAAMLLGRDGVGDLVLSFSRGLDLRAGGVVLLGLVLDGEAATMDADGIVDLASAVRDRAGVAINARVPSTIDPLQATMSIDLLGDIDGDGVADLGVGAFYSTPTFVVVGDFITEDTLRVAEYYLLSGRLIEEAAANGGSLLLE